MMMWAFRKNYEFKRKKRLNVQNWNRNSWFYLMFGKPTVLRYTTVLIQILIHIYAKEQILSCKQTCYVKQLALEVSKLTM